MPEVANTQSHSQDLHLTLNSDGRRHPILNIAAVFSFAAGIAAFACGLIVAAHTAATVLGIAAFAVGLLVQLNSATREQRVIDRGRDNRGICRDGPGHRARRLLLGASAAIRGSDAREAVGPHH